MARTLLPDGTIGCTASVLIQARALRRLGLHPDQPTSQITTSYPSRKR